MTPAGRRMLDGSLIAVEPLFHGVVPEAQVMLVLVAPGSPRASITAPELGYEEEDNMRYKTEQKSRVDNPYTLASMNEGEPVVVDAGQLLLEVQIALSAVAPVCADAGKAKTIRIARVNTSAERTPRELSSVVGFILLSSLDKVLYQPLLR
jgi:hypothetical protein